MSTFANHLSRDVACATAAGSSSTIAPKWLRSSPPRALIAHPVARPAVKRRSHSRISAVVGL